MDWLSLILLELVLCLFCASSIIGTGWVLQSLLLPNMTMLICSFIAIGVYCVLFVIAFVPIVKSAVKKEKESQETEKREE